MFNPVKKPTRTGQIVDEIRAAIADGRFHTGDRLPPERELAVMFGVSRTSIREAVKILETYGQIRSVQGGGLYVTDRFSERVFDFLGHGSGLTIDNYKSIYQARLVMETGSAISNLHAITADDLRQLEDYVRQSEEETDPVELQRIDANFHHAIIQFSRNPVLTSLYQMMYKIMTNNVQHGISVYPEAKSTVITEHRKIIAALASGSRTRVCNAIARHLDVALGMFAVLLGDGEAAESLSENFRKP